MKKQMQVIALIVCMVVILTGIRQFDIEQSVKAEKNRRAAFGELFHDMTVKSLNRLEEIQYSFNEKKGGDTFDTMLEWFRGWYQGVSNQQAVRYQMTVPCHFFINVYPAKDPLNTYEYRNVDENDEILWDEYSRVNMIPAYVADVILDTYIRDCGGEDTQYHIELEVMDWKEPELCLDYSMKIYNDSVTLNVEIWNNGLPGAGSVYIEDCDGAEVQYKRMIEYAYHMDVEGYYDYFRKYWDDAYCMFIDPEPEQKEYHYRNIQPIDTVSEREELVCDAFSYAIADRAIDKYIRDWDGRDILYDVKLVNKIKDEEKGTYHYTLSVMDKDEEVLQVEYTEKEWFVMVNICNQ